MLMGHNHTLKIIYCLWTGGDGGGGLKLAMLVGDFPVIRGSQLGETPQILNFNKHIKPMNRNKHQSP